MSTSVQCLPEKILVPVAKCQEAKSECLVNYNSRSGSYENEGNEG